jgi:predicted HicB family RNase H-like nuclease
MLKYSRRALIIIGGVMAEPKQTTSLKVDPELWKQAKHEAIDEGTSIGLLVEKALREYIKEKKGK